MDEFKTILSEDIDLSLKDTTRQYLAGMLKRPQILEYIEDGDVEIGFTSYPEYKYEPAHYHTATKEYQYMIKGCTRYIDIGTGETFEFKKGDFFMIGKNVKYAQKSLAGTKILFIKTVPGDDKVLIEAPEDITLWLIKW